MDSGYRISYLIFLYLFHFFFLLKKKYPELSFNILISICILLYLSPYFRTSSYWAHQENLPIFFTLISLFYLEMFKIKKIKQNLIHIFGIAVISSLAFYSDQKYIFVSFYCFISFIFIYKNDVTKLIQIAFFFSLFLLCLHFIYFICGKVFCLYKANLE